MVKKTYLGRAGLLAILAAMLLVAPALAAVNFDSDTGKGFVGKGDVQIALGLNNAQMQAQATSVKFTYVTTDTYTVTEVWATGNPDQPKSLSSHDISKTTTVGVNAQINGVARPGPNQYTGFNLNGFIGTPVVSGTLPEVDTVNFVPYTWTDKQGNTYTTDEMPVDENGNLYTEGNNKAIVSVEKFDSTGGLYVNGVLLPQV